MPRSTAISRPPRPLMYLQMPIQARKSSCCRAFALRVNRRGCSGRVRGQTPAMAVAAMAFVPRVHRFATCRSRGPTLNFVPRPPRIQFAGATYHVTARGNRRQIIFASPTDYDLYTAMLRRIAHRLGWRILEYCLMPNHVHLVLQTLQPNLSRGMQWLHGTYATCFNERHGVSGHLFQGRFDSVLVEDEDHLAELSRYVPNNPVRAGLCAHANEWPWSSATAAMTRPERPWPGSDPGHGSNGRLAAPRRDRRKAPLEDLQERGRREADDVQVVAFDPLDERGAAALDRVPARAPLPLAARPRTRRAPRRRHRETSPAWSPLRPPPTRARPGRAPRPPHASAPRAARASRAPPLHRPACRACRRRAPPSCPRRAPARRTPTAPSPARDPEEKRPARRPRRTRAPRPRTESRAAPGSPGAAATWTRA